MKSKKNKSRSNNKMESWENRWKVTEERNARMQSTDAVVWCVCVSLLSIYVLRRNEDPNLVGMVGHEERFLPSSGLYIALEFTQGGGTVGPS